MGLVLRRVAVVGGGALDVGDAVEAAVVSVFAGSPDPSGEATTGAWVAAGAWVGLGGSVKVGVTSGGGGVEVGTSTGGGGGAAGGASRTLGTSVGGAVAQGTTVVVVAGDT